MNWLAHQLWLLKTFWEVTFPPKSKFEPERDIPDLTDRVFIVTGANSGCGYYTTKALLVKNAKVYLACRDEGKALKAIEELEDATGKKGKNLAQFLQLDLASLKSVKVAADEFLRKETRLDCLFNNAAVMWCSADWVTEDGYDMQFGTNVVGPFYFNQLLLPTLLSTAKANNESGTGTWKGARVITTSSMGHSLSGPLKEETFTDTAARKKKSTEWLYYQSKLANVLYADELDRRYGHEGIVSVSLNPGNINTNLQRYANPITLRILQWILHPTPLGALTQLYVGTVSDPSGLGGKYYVPWAREGQKDFVAEDRHMGEKLWTWLEDEVKRKTQGF